MKTITENRDKLKAMLYSHSPIVGSELKKSMDVIGTDLMGSSDTLYGNPEKQGMQCVLNDWNNIQPENDFIHQEYYRKVIREILGYVKMAQEKDPIANA